MFQEVEKGFDNLFNHNRKLDESFEYYNVIKNGTIDEQLEMQEKQLVSEMNNVDTKIERFENLSTTHVEINVSENAKEFTSADLGLTSALGIFAPEVHGEDWENEDFIRRKKLEQKRRGRRL